MKLGISYNLFDGEELLEYSIQSVRNSADHINVVYQKISNWGEPCSENLEDLLSDLVKKKLIDKIYCYTPKNTSAGKNELHKRNIGLNIAKARFCSHFHNMDCDEFYHKNQFDEAKNLLSPIKSRLHLANLSTTLNNQLGKFKTIQQHMFPLLPK